MNVYERIWMAGRIERLEALLYVGKGPAKTD